MEDLSRLVGPLAALFVVLLGIAFTIFWVAGTWKMFEKADQPGWGVLVPIYNMILIVRIAGLPDWMFLLFLIPGLNIVAHIIASLELGKRFSKSAGFVVGMIFLAPVFYALIGYSADWYTPPPPPSEDDPLRPAPRTPQV